MEKPSRFDFAWSQTDPEVRKRTKSLKRKVDFKGVFSFFFFLLFFLCVFSSFLHVKRIWCQNSMLNHVEEKHFDPFFQNSSQIIFDSWIILTWWDFNHAYHNSTRVIHTQHFSLRWLRESIQVFSIVTKKSINIVKSLLRGFPTQVLVEIILNRNENEMG